ncbi:MAG TPA: MOSC N-terminal beta barrel domain-containing protein [Candidatus Saccharimonadales bacterium]|nr:MOSC N-terminal beta barrel domain-containing protein [Candidatus Saccharimonadales bacterium]
MTSVGTDGTAGTVVGLWRYPVKSMQGEELNAAELTERGCLGDRAYALLDRETGKVASAKNPRKWGRLFDFRAAFVDPPRIGAPLPAVRITLPDGSVVTSGQDDVDAILSRAIGREVTLGVAGLEQPSLEEYWPDIEGLTHRDKVTDEAMPPRTFFDFAVVHVLTTATIDRLRTLYPAGRVEPRRFRPNIIVGVPSGEQDFVENAWIGRTLALGDGVRLSITGPCPRCVMTTLPQGDLPKDGGILLTAARNNDTHVGVYAAVHEGGTLHRGDPARLQ